MEASIALERINRRLKEDKIAVRLLMHGDKLYLQATLPKKNGEGYGNKQRQIALGLPTNGEGFREAEFKARELGRSLIIGTFNWADWDVSQKSGGNLADIVTTAQIVAQFRADYLAHNQLTNDTWQRHWQALYDKLPQAIPLQASTLLAEVLLLPMGSWTRRQACLKYQKLADFAGIEVNLKKYQGDYGRASQKELVLPTDKTIAQLRHSITNPAWQWVYGIMATFGIRDHEAFFCHFENDSHGEVMLKVEEGKTGSRVVYPYYQQWLIDWCLEDIIKPKIRYREEKKYQDCGDRVGKAFKRIGIPWIPYTLRHAYAIRESVLFGLPLADAAKNMGHSPDVHLKTYNRWINQEHRSEVFQQKKDLILPPKV